MTATDQLRELGHKSADCQHAYDDMIRQMNRELPTLQARAFHDMEAFAWEAVAMEAQERSESIASASGEKSRTGLPTSLQMRSEK